MEWKRPKLTLWVMMRMRTRKRRSKKKIDWLRRLPTSTSQWPEERREDLQANLASQMQP
jgi:hypothetical protein